MHTFIYTVKMAEQVIQSVDIHFNHTEREWQLKQNQLKQKLSEEDSSSVLAWNCAATNEQFVNLKLLGGVDISFDKDNPDKACAIIVILSYPDLQVIHNYHVICHMTEPYIPGFLAFREVPHLLACLDDLRKTRPELVPQVIMVDGNGVLHARGCGLASHLGVLAGIPTIGIGKKLYHVDGLEKNKEHKAKVQSLLKHGDSFDLVGQSLRVWGCALRTGDDAVNPIYVSVGHMISLETATDLVARCSPNRIPEPVRQADILSRKILRDSKDIKNNI